MIDNDKKQQKAEQKERVRQRMRVKVDAENYEYSRPFIDKLCEVVGGLKGGRSYRLTGTAMPAEKVAVFSLKTIVPITKQE